MTRSAFDKIRTGLGEAKAYLDGSADKHAFGIHVPARVNVKKIRTRLGLSQESFAQTYGFALSAVRDWEQGDVSRSAVPAFCSKLLRRNLRP
jgi:putative transcriptional regulator